MVLFVGLISSTFTITNSSPYTIWPGTHASAGTSQLATTGFQLDSRQSASLCQLQDGQATYGQGPRANLMCMGTGDYGGRLQCDGSEAAPPTLLFEIILGQGQGDCKDFYDVSMVNGCNLPMLEVPRRVYGECNATGCASDLNLCCTKKLQVVGRRYRWSRPVRMLVKYCCSDQFASPTTCQPSNYSTTFKRACSRSCSCAFNDGTSIFTCKAIPDQTGSSSSQSLSNMMDRCNHSSTMWTQ